MTIKQLYDKYQIMPQLATHMLRVGGIVKLINDDRDSICTALLHDMGNMAKFTGLDEYWSGEQLKFWDKYGKDANEATFKILEEAGLSKYYNYMKQESGLYKVIDAKTDYSSYSLPAVLTLYSDSRVAMGGVVSLEERIVDLETRYHAKRNDREWAYNLEKYVQSLTKIPVSTISESDVAPLFDELLSSQI